MAHPRRLAVVVVVLLAVSAGRGLAQEYENCRMLQADAMTIRWTMTATSIDVQMEGTGMPNGYMSVGLYPANANQRPDFHTVGGDPIIDLWVASGTTVFDGSMQGESTDTDNSDDLTGGVAAVVDGVLTATFSRLLDTGDADDQIIPAAGEITVGYACARNQAAQPNEDVPKHDGNIECGGVTSIDFSVAQTCDEVDGGQFISPGGDFEVVWALSADDDTLMEFTVKGQTAGYVAFGFGDGAHVNADFFVGWVTGGTTTLLDQYSNARSQGVNDATNDLTVIDGTEENGVTTITFTRPLVLGNADDVDIVDEPLILNWAINPNDGTGTTYSQHTIAGTASVNFLAGEGGVGAAGSGGRTAAFGVNLVASLTFAIWVIVRYIHKAIKACKRRKRDAEYDATGGRSAPRSHAPAADGGAHRPAPLPDNPIFAPSGSPAITPTKPPRPPTAVLYGGDFATRESYGYDEYNTGGDEYYDDTYYDGGWEEVAAASPVAPPPKAPRSPPARPARGPSGPGGPGGAPPIPSRGQSKPNVYYRGSMRVANNNDDDYLNGGSWDSETGDDPSYVDFASGMRGAFGSGLEGADRRMTLTPAKKLEGKEQKNRVKAFCFRRVPKSSATIADVLLAGTWVLINIIFVMIAPAGGPPVSDQFAYLAAANALYAVIPATRNSLLSVLLGIHVDHTLLYHRWVGRLSVIFAGLHHFISVINVGFGAQFTTGKYVLGLLGALCAYSIVITALEWFRRRHFNFFYFTHFAFFGYFGFAALHSRDMTIYVVVASIFYVIDRVARLFFGLSPRSVSLVRVKAGGVVQLRFPKAYFATYRPGQYVFLNVPSISLLEWHPYTLSSSPLEPELEVHIKALGDHTGKVLTKAEGGDSFRVRVDGPYGKLSLNERRYETVMLFSGGVGVTPMIAVLKTIYCLNAAKVPKTRGATRDVYFVWSVKAEEELWFTDELEAIRARAAESDGWPNLHLYVHVTKASTVSDPSYMRTGRPDLPAVFQHCEGTQRSGRVAVYVCGPSAMVDDVWDLSKARSNDTVHYAIHHEVFDF